VEELSVRGESDLLAVQYISSLSDIVLILEKAVYGAESRLSLHENISMKTIMACINPCESMSED
jgi:hypothetical protein